MKKGSGFLYTSIQGIRFILHTETGMLLLHLLFTFLHGISWTLQVVFTQRFFDSVQSLVERNVSLTSSMIALWCMIAAYAFCQVMNGVDNCHARILSLAVAKQTNLNIYRRVDQMDCIEFEDAKRLDYINQAIHGAEDLVWVCLTLLDTIFFYTTYFVFMGIYLYTLKPVLSISILAIFLPCLISNFIKIRTFHDLETVSAPIRRECDYYESCAADVRETRLWGVNDYFKQRFYSCLKTLNRFLMRAQLKKSVVNLLMDSITVIGYGVILFMIFVFVLRQEITVGAFAAVLASIGRLFSFMSEVISERIGWASEHVAAAENFMSFVADHNDQSSGQVFCGQADITLQGVEFKYPQSEKFALKNLDFTIRKGQTLAIVGENGSGKTTLCRLLLGLYTPTKGQILIGDIPARDVSDENWSAIYQDYCRYKMTLKNNIAISNTQQSADDAKIEEICEKAGIVFNHETLPNGIETMLGREFDGAELSGGQWQRVAIARGIYRPYDFIVLDEPTSVIDPLEETRLYQEFIKICEGKTAVVVTHRLSSVKIADCIIVMKDGMIAEHGTHAELMEKNGEYKRMYDMQSRWYV
ncbi:MAG: ABC transporter ATP-binding protein [Lachnospiraceae bacterium]